MVCIDIIVNSAFQFLDEISSNVSKESSGVEDAVVLKEGWVIIIMSLNSSIRKCFVHIFTYSKPTWWFNELMVTDINNQGYRKVLPTVIRTIVCLQN